MLMIVLGVVAAIISCAGVLSIGLGYRITPKTTLSVTTGIGLTADSPNLSLGLSLPLAF